MLPIIGSVLSVTREYEGIQATGRADNREMIVNVYDIANVYINVDHV